jgi:hydrogenase expression/formation protein
MKKNKIKLDIIGRVEKGKSVYLEHKNKSSKIVKEKLSPKFREEPYTPIKKIVDRPPSDFERMKKKLGKSALDAKSKKEYVKDWILEH